MSLALRWSFLLLLIRSVDADYVMQQAIKAFVEYHSKGCHYLLFTYSNEFYDQRLLIDFYKAAIKNNFIPTVLENIDNANMNNSDFAKVPCSRPLRTFILGDISSLSRYMITEKRRVDIRKNVWLLFVTNDFDQKLIISQIPLSIRSEVYIARKTEYGYTYWEIYAPMRHSSVRIIYYGDWNADSGLMKATRLPVLKRRRDFGGAVLRAARFETQHYNSIESARHAELLGVVSQLLGKVLNFTIEFVTIPDNSSKYQFNENPQNIIIRMLARNEADISMIGQRIDAEGQSIIDYSGTVVQTHFRVYMKKYDDDIEWGLHFLHPLPFLAWYSTILIVALLPVIVLFMYYVGRKAGLIETQSNVLDLYFTVHRMLCLQDTQEVSRQELCSVSLLFVFFNLWAFLIRSIYSASLASSLTIEHHTLPFDSLEGLLKNGDYEFGVHRYSSAYKLYYETDDLFIKKLNKAVMEQNISKLPTTYLEGLQRVCSEKKYAFMASSMSVAELKSKISCKLHHLPNGGYTVSTAYAMSKHNEYLPFINLWLHMLTEAGLMRKLKHDIVGSEFSNSQDSQSFRNLEFKDTFFLQFLLIGGILLSILILIAEILYSRMKR